jgi:carbon storage regulator CsrA
MLVLGRKLNEVIVIETPEGRVIEIEIVRIGDGGTRLGITAEREVKVRRKELERYE